MGRGAGCWWRYGLYIQNERKPIYMEYAKKLIEFGDAYCCLCTANRLQKLHDENGVGGYDRHCHDLKPEEVQEKRIR